MGNMEKFQENIGYTFKETNLLRQALTHSSYANEKRMKRLSDNERLEFLGDAVLEIISSEYLYQQYSNVPEGDLTKLRASLVCEQTLATCARQINLGDFLFLGKGEDLTGGRTRKSILSDALEAVIGSVYLDGGFANAKEFILKYILTDIEHKKLFYDSKTILQEVVQGEHSDNLSYAVVCEEGPDHAKVFTVEARIGGKVVGVGDGTTKKAAEQEAAYEALLRLERKVKNTCI
ncbi:MAG: ribonuclease III [Lachnospiraceae bacterium]